MKKLIVCTLIAVVLLVGVASQASAYPASMTEADQAARPFITTNLRTVKTNVLADIPSRLRDYILWDRLSSNVPMASSRVVVPVTGAYSAESFKAFKELQADLFSGK